ncbi:MAG: diguanylate cyclase [Acidimicrobiales bacterium]
MTAIAFAGWASWSSIQALQTSGAATEDAAALASLQTFHQDSVIQLSIMQSAVLESVLAAQGVTARTPAEVRADLDDAADALTRNEEAISALDPAVSPGLALPDVELATARYVEDAARLSALAADDQATAVTRLDAFLTTAEPLFADMAEITSITSGAAERAAITAENAEQSATDGILVTSAFGTAMIIAITALVAYSIAKQLRQLSKIARAMAAGELHVRNEIRSADELGGLARSFDAMADSFEDLVGKLEREASQDAFRRQLFDAFDMAADDSDVQHIVEEAMVLIGEHPSEMLLSDSSKHHVTQAVTHPEAGAPDCPVGSTGQCVAVRRGHRLVFESSNAIDACPHLKRRGEPCSAVCVPVTFNGQAMGVIHATGPDGEKPDALTVDRLAALASQTGARLGTIHAFQGAREQASIDGLTGLVNRRTLENEARAFAAADMDYAVIMCDLDHFKNLNDHYGHEMGDRALRLFGQVLRSSVREGDVAARLGGEEFVLLQPRMTAVDAVATIERIQLSLAARLGVSDGPSFTSSFGVSDTLMAPGFDAALRVADAGLLAAKDQGRNCWVMGDPEMANELAGRGRPRGSAGDLMTSPHGPTVLPERI